MLTIGISHGSNSALAANTEAPQNAPQRIGEAVKGLEAMGGKLVSFYTVMGEYDHVGIAEAPSDEVAMTYLLGLGAAGNIRTTCECPDRVAGWGGLTCERGCNIPPSQLV